MAGMSMTGIMRPAATDELQPPFFSGSEALVVTSGPAGAVVFSPDGFVAGASVSEDVVVTAGSSAVVAPAASSAAANSHPVNSHFG
jgi:uncharacterized protein (DUF2345 family)